MRSSTLSLSVLALCSTSAVAHMAMWSDANYGFNNPYDAVKPLANLPFTSWWFHGYHADKPFGVMNITAGQPLTVEISCHKRYTTYGRETTTDSCPHDSGAYHAGGVTNTQNRWTGNSEANLMGCALAIAPTTSAASTSIDDFVVMSILSNCVRQRDTTFAIPANLPECPNGECTCAWFWQGKNSAPEMYMTGFRCRVIGGVATPFPRPLPPRKNAVSGPVQPQYWANDINNIGYAPDYNTRPTYNAKWGWSEGAQTAAFRVAEEPSTTSTAEPVRTSGVFNGARRAHQARVWAEFAPMPQLANEIVGGLVLVDEEDELEMLIEEEEEVLVAGAVAEYVEDRVSGGHRTERRSREHRRGKVLV